MRSSTQRLVDLATSSLALAHRLNPEKIEAAEDEVLFAKIAFRMERMMETGKRPMSQANRDRLCEFLSGIPHEVRERE